MVITRTPFRISFFGGGTDYRPWFEENGGLVISATIDKYCWISCRTLPPFFEHRSRIVYSYVENVLDVDEIRHPSARECLKFMGIDKGVEIHHDGDLPARTGIGSSSSFTVGLLLALNAWQGKMIDDEKLALNAIDVEQNWIRENVGCQDQVAAAYGGLNLIEFGGDAAFRVKPICLGKDKIHELESSLLLVFTGVSRTASDIAAEQIAGISAKKNELVKMMDLTRSAFQVLASGDIGGFGKMLHEGWMLKKSLSGGITTPLVDELYSKARSAGALGGKLIGAGGGGFMLFFCQPESRDKVQQALSGYLHVPFKLDRQGAQVVHYQSSE